VSRAAKLTYPPPDGRSGTPWSPSVPCLIDSRAIAYSPYRSRNGVNLVVLDSIVL
jgi:hypothetical protein